MDGKIFYITKKKLEEILPSGYFINAQGYLRVLEQAQTKEEL